ncbi:MAG: DUF4276 family protein [Deltaproteobacteria bacterium]|nr:DUF4276 family protein [Deltaproteobacteria bacterium]
MIRVYVVVEGQTEEAVVKSILEPHLSSMGVYLFPIIVKTSPGHRGGGTHWAKWENDIRNLLKQHKGQGVRVTTLFDLFRLPKGFPELDEHGADTNTSRRCDALAKAIDEIFDDRRFIPYLQRHELEALVLASLDGLEEFFDDSDALKGLSDLKNEIGDQAPEDINDGPETAPSKRLMRYIPGYSKTLHGPMAIEDTGLQAVRERCPRFDQWIKILEALADRD